MRVFSCDAARVLSFGQLCLQAGARTEPGVQEALSALSQSSYMVQGNWVVKRFVGLLVFSLLSFTAVLCCVSALPHGRQLIARDFVMSQFWRTRVLQRGDLKDLLKLDTEQLDEIFEEFAVRLFDSSCLAFMRSSVLLGSPA